MIQHIACARSYTSNSHASSFGVQDDAKLLPHQPLPVALQLSSLHSIVLGSRPTWLLLHSAQSLNCLEDLDLQVPCLWHHNPL